MPDTTPLTDEQVAALWVVYTETGSYKATARQLGITDVTVARHVRKDPIRHSALVAARADARAERWRLLEEQAIDETHEVLALLVKTRKDVQRPGRGHKGMEPAARLAVLPRVMSALQRLAGDAAIKTQLLTGGVTDRPGAEGGQDGEELSDDQLVALVTELGLEMPPGLADRMGVKRKPVPRKKPATKRRKKAPARKKQGKRR